MFGGMAWCSLRVALGLKGAGEKECRLPQSGDDEKGVPAVHILLNCNGIVAFMSCFLLLAGSSPSFRVESVQGDGEGEREKVKGQRIRDQVQGTDP